MAVQENPVVAELNNLNALIGKLSAEQKAKENILKDLNEQVKLAEAEATMKIKAAKERHDATIAQLTVETHPLEARRQELATLKTEIATLQQARLDMIAEIKSSKNAEIAAVNLRLATVTDKLDHVNQELANHKARIASL